MDRLARPAALRGTITTPWRVVMVAADLNTLVNCDIVSHVSPPARPGALPRRARHELGQARAGRLEVPRRRPDDARRDEGILAIGRRAGVRVQRPRGLLADGGATTSSATWSATRRSHGVGIWLWIHSKELRTPEARRAFFEKCRDVGAVGAKIDFFDHEAKEVVDLYPELLREAARSRILVDFHGANKPTGESRTWPNELGREGVYGLEHKGMKEWARHNTTLPFTRLLAGPADYTPVLFGDRRRETSWAHQVASAAVLSSPLLVYAAHPTSLLTNPAAEMIKSIPSVWDETIVLPPSEIGELAAFARRSGDRWFLAILNGPEARTLRLPLSFLKAGNHRALMVRDRDDDPAAVRLEEATVTKDDAIDIRLRAGGGFIARFDRAR